MALVYFSEVNTLRHVNYLFLRNISAILFPFFFVSTDYPEFRITSHISGLQYIFGNFETFPNRSLRKKTLAENGDAETRLRTKSRYGAPDRAPMLMVFKIFDYRTSIVQKILNFTL
jgi:hypothetical protein